MKYTRDIYNRVIDLIREVAKEMASDREKITKLKAMYSGDVGEFFFDIDFFSNDPIDEIVDILNNRVIPWLENEIKRDFGVNVSLSDIRYTRSDAERVIRELKDSGEWNHMEDKEITVPTEIFLAKDELFERIADAIPEGATFPW